MSRVADVFWAVVVLLGYLIGVLPVAVVGAHRALGRWTRECLDTVRWHLIGRAGRKRAYDRDMERMLAKFHPPDSGRLAKEGG